MTWQVATVAAVRDETTTARTLVLDVPDWPGHLAGQHLDVRLTAPDGYRATRSYSIASGADGDRVELTVEAFPEGEVSPVRAHAATGAGGPVRMLYSVRRPEAVIYAAELAARSAGGELALTLAYTREAPAGWSRPPGRVDAALVTGVCWPPSASPTTYVCGPTPFVETVADLLVGAGHDQASIRTERFGPGGSR